MVPEPADANLHPVLFYDGQCGFCSATVQFVLRHDTKGDARFAPLQGAHARRFLDAHPDLRGLDSMFWTEPGRRGAPPRVWARSGAALRVARYLGGMWKLALIGVVIPRGMRDWAYDLVARHRHRLLGSAPQCVIPPPDAKSRFLDLVEGEHGS